MLVYDPDDPNDPPIDHVAFVTVTPEEVYLGPGQQQEFTGYAWNARGQEVAATFTWSVSPEALGTVNPAIGKTTTFTAGANPGSCTVTATHEPSSVSGSATVHVVKVSQSDDLWWFNGEWPAGYYIEIILTAEGATSGTFRWEVTAGAEKVDLNNGGADADVIEATDDNTVVIKSTAPSAAAPQVTKDIEVTLTINGGWFTEIYCIVVLSPGHLEFLWQTDEPFGGGFKSTIIYQIRDQFERVLPRNVPWNEDITGDGAADDAAAVGDAAISDWTIANGKPEDEDWPWGEECGWIVNPANAFDTIRRAGPTWAPTPQNPHVPPENDKIDHSPQGDWYVGSITIGRGVHVKDCVWQIYRDHGAHQ